MKTLKSKINLTVILICLMTMIACEDVPITNATLRPKQPEIVNGGRAVSDVAVEGITLFPNPTTEYISIKTDAKVESVKIIDLKGRVLKQTSATEAGQRISVGDLTAGFYIAQVKTEAGEKGIRFIVKR